MIHIYCFSRGCSFGFISVAKSKKMKSSMEVLRFGHVGKEFVEELVSRLSLEKKPRADEGLRYVTCTRLYFSMRRRGGALFSCHFGCDLVRVPSESLPSLFLQASYYPSSSSDPTETPSWNTTPSHACRAEHLKSPFLSISCVHANKKKRNKGVSLILIIWLGLIPRN